MARLAEDVREAPGAARLEGFGACRLCGAVQPHLLTTTEAWIAAARRARDVRAKIAGLVAADAAIDFAGLVQCGSCGLRSVGRPPAADALGGFYRSYYANDEYGGKREKKLARAARRLAGLGPGAGRRFLDVGCNLGFAVEAARRAGFAAYGIEIDGDAVAQAAAAFPGCAFTQADAPAFAAQGAQFDLVWCTEVIEHVVDIHRFADALAALTAPGGALFLTTPDAGHPRRGPFLDWAEVKPPEHLQWFERSQLARLLEPRGFRLRFAPAWKPGIKLWAVRSRG